MDEFTFNGQRKGEKVKVVVQTHPLVLFWPGLKAVFFIALGVGTILKFPGQFAGLVLVICILIAISLISRAWFQFSQSVFLITNQRVINVDQEGYFKRKITETELLKVQAVSSDTTGLVKTIFKYGDLVIRVSGSSSSEDQLRIKDIPNPYEVQQRLAKIKQDSGQLKPDHGSGI